MTTAEDVDAHRGGAHATDAYQVDPTATVEDGAAVGPGTRIWNLSYVRAGARIGAGCNIGRNVYVDPGVVVGDRCKVQNNVSLYVGVTLGDEVFVGPTVVFSNDLAPRAGLEHFTVVPTVVEDGASIGAGAVVVCGTTIGRSSFVGAGAVVTRDVEPHRLVVGNPARPVAWVDRDGAVVSRDAARPPQHLLDRRTRR